MTPYDSEDLTDIIEQHDGQFVVLQSPDTAEHEPCYEEVARFDTLEAKMQRDELERLNKAELIELVLRLQRPGEDIAYMIQATIDRSQGARRAGSLWRRQDRA